MTSPSEPIALNTLRIDCEPVPASRPRVAKFGTYYAKPYRDFMAMAQDRLPKGDKHSGLVALVVSCVCTKPKTGKLLAPRGDIDNYIKGVMDVLTKKEYWEDDSQVYFIIAEKRYAQKDEKAHISVKIYSKQSMDEYEEKFKEKLKCDTQ